MMPSVWAKRASAAGLINWRRPRCSSFSFPGSYGLTSSPPSEVSTIDGMRTSEGAVC